MWIFLKAVWITETSSADSMVWSHPARISGVSHSFSTDYRDAQLMHVTSFPLHNLTKTEAVAVAVSPGGESGRMCRLPGLPSPRLWACSCQACENYPAGPSRIRSVCMLLHELTPAMSNLSLERCDECCKYTYGLLDTHIFCVAIWVDYWSVSWFRVCNIHSLSFSGSRHSCLPSYCQWEHASTTHSEAHPVLCPERCEGWGLGAPISAALIKSDRLMNDKCLWL